MPGRLEFDLNFGRSGREREESEPMRLLVIGDFSGRPVEERAPLASRPTVRIDVDNVDDVMKRMEPRVTLGAAELRFKTVDDFHPDRLYTRLDLFRALRDARAAPPTDHEDQFTRLLGAPAPPDESAAPPPATGLEALIRNVVAPHVVKDTSARVASHQAAADTASSHEMRTLLHDPAFMRMEATWRGVRWLIAGLELDVNLQLHLFDVTRDELLGDIVAAQGKLGETQVYRALIDRLQPGDRWSTLVGLLNFGPSNADIGLLAALGLIASRAGGPFLGDADLALAGDDPQTLAAWQMLRRSEAAKWIGLGVPRVLLRWPYGPKSEPIETFAFEEFVGAPPSGELLWGNASLALALLIGRAFTARGWEMEPGDERLIGGFPAYTFDHEGERVLQPCAERVLSERETDALLRAGLVPIASRRDRDEVVVVRFQSVSDPPAPLAW